MSQRLDPEPATDAALRSAIARVRGGWRRRRMMEGAPAIIAAALVALLIGLALRAVLTSAESIVVLTRAAGYVVVAAAIVRYVIVPGIRRVSDESVALYVEEHAPELHQLLVSAVETDADGAHSGSSPALRALVSTRALAEIVRLLDGGLLERASRNRALQRLGLLSVAGAALIVLGPAAVRQMARVLFVPWSHAAAEVVPMMTVSPGNVKVPRGAALDIRAQLRSLADRGAEVVLRADSSDRWIRVPMVRDSTADGYVARVFDINHATTYYVDAGSLRSPDYRITVTDLPTVQQLSLELHYPAYTGLPVAKIDNGGDVVAVVGTTAIVDVEPTLPVTHGTLRFDDGAQVPITQAADGHLRGSFRVAHDGFYRVDLTATDGTLAPGTVQHSVEALADHPPTVRIESPGRDTRVTSIEEVPIAIRASDDYGVRNLALDYAINGGPDHSVNVTDSGGHNALDVRAVHTLYLEELSLHVGDLIAYHATARDGAGHEASSDIYFMEVRPFGRDYHAADDNGGGGGGGGGGDNPGRFTEEQRQIIAGTFNWQRDSAVTSERDRGANATTLALAQGKLATEVAAQAARMMQRQVAAADSEFVLVQAELDSAVRAMGPAEDGLGRRVVRDAIPAQEHALQHLQAADDAFRDITVRRGQGGGGGGGGGGANSNAADLADLFELQTDKLKNQYEMPRSETSTPTQAAVDSVAERLKALAARQQEENQREQHLAAQMQQRLGGEAGQGQAGGQTPQGSSSTSGQSGSGGGGRAAATQGPQGARSGGGPTGSAQRELARQAEEQARQLEKLSREQNSPELADAAQRAQQAADAMRQAAAGSPQQGSAALDRLRDAAQNIQGAESAGQRQVVDDLARRAGALGQQQRDIGRDVAGLPAASGAAHEQQMTALDERKDALRDSVNQLEGDADRVAQQLRSSQPEAAAAAAGAAGQLRNRQISAAIDASKRVMESGQSPEYLHNIEDMIGETLDSVAQQLAAASGRVGTGREQRQAAALDRTRDLVRDLESLRDRTGSDSGAASGAQQPQGQPGQEGQSGQPGRSGQSGRSGQTQTGQSGQQGGAAGRGAAGRQGSGAGAMAGTGEPGGSGNGKASGGADRRQFRNEVAQRAQAADSLRRELAAEGVDVTPLDRAIQQMQQLQQATNPGRVDQLQSELVAGLKEFEFNVWRRFNASASAPSVLGASAQVPPEYRAMVEEYYRALARKGSN